ncbi:MlaA family lipoprotein [Paracraurococcus lichenis]|uniref:VacJ family lipoprotein n=1 Tax=Paracraurococcus lichenis TaxID=3064888 RepID=A0ABT9DSA7_9PROT|nr:VacJ family lipoprotein [Paracraurococcus sp. LOR1-02]MDO9706780.1 VacJ family lipoprotein [Paracraurococcus sp. LOR1-02]
MAATSPAEGRRGAAFALAALLALGPIAARAEGDPLEAVNRRVHGFNREVHARLLQPLLDAYRAVVPAPVRQGFANAVGNLSEPVTVASSLAAGRFDLAWNAAARFGLNSTLGLGGAWDAAAARGYPREVFRVADALCHWGLPSGPYLVLPLLGPSSLRDAGGMLATGAALSQAVGSDALLAWSSADALVSFAEVDPALRQVEHDSLDPYAVLRSVYRQRRALRCAVDRDPED